MKEIFKSLVYSNIWVSLAVASFTFITMVNLVTINAYFLLFVTCSSMFSYNYMRLVDISAYDLRHNFNFKAWVVGHRRQVWILTLVFGLLTFFFFLEIFSIRLVWLLLLPTLVSILYPLSFKRSFSGFTSLRMVPGLKMFLIAATWAYVTVFIPVVLYGSLTLEDVLECIMRTVLVLGLVVPFDIRDVSYDDPNMRTIPQVLGAERARQLAMFFVLLYQLWLVLRFFFFDASLPYTIAILIGLEIGYWLIRYSHREHSDEYFSFWIEGVPIFCAVLVVVARVLM